VGNKFLNPPEEKAINVKKKMFSNQDRGKKYMGTKVRQWNYGGTRDRLLGFDWRVRERGKLPGPLTFMRKGDKERILDWRVEGEKKNRGKLFSVIKNREQSTLIIRKEREIEEPDNTDSMVSTRGNYKEKESCEVRRQAQKPGMGKKGLRKLVIAKNKKGDRQGT